MTETEFLSLADAVLHSVELAFEAAAEAASVDVECARTGNVLEVEFIERGSKIIVNAHVPAREIWVAAKSGGFHFRHEDGCWLDTRGGGELFATLSSLATRQSGQPLSLAPPC